MVAGVDHHNGLYYVNMWTGLTPSPFAPPYVPAPIPPGMTPSGYSFHAVVTCADHISLDDKSNPTVLAEGAAVVSKDHAAKHVVHIPPGGNILTPLVILFSSATWKLAVASVVGANGSLASTAISSIGFTNNCADPCSMPLNLMVSVSSVHIEPSGADWACAGVEYFVTAVIEIGLSFAFTKLGDAAKRYIAKRLALQATARTAKATSSFSQKLVPQLRSLEKQLADKHANEARRALAKKQLQLERELFDFRNSAKRTPARKAAEEVVGEFAVEGLAGWQENVAGNKAGDFGGWVGDKARDKAGELFGDSPPKRGTP